MCDKDSVLVIGSTLRSLPASFATQKDGRYIATPELEAALADANAADRQLYERMREVGLTSNEAPVVEFSGKGWETGHCRYCGAPMLGKAVYGQGFFGGYSRSAAPSFCSKGCQSEHTREYQREYHQAYPRPRKAKTDRVCAECGGTFRAKRSDARFCGATCRQRAKRRKADPEVADLKRREAVEKISYD